LELRTLTGGGGGAGAGSFSTRSKITPKKKSSESPLAREELRELTLSNIAAN